MEFLHDFPKLTILTFLPFLPNPQLFQNFFGWKTNMLNSRVFQISFFNTLVKFVYKVQRELLHRYGRYKLQPKVQTNVEKLFMYKNEPKKNCSSQDNNVK